MAIVFHQNDAQNEVIVPSFRSLPPNFFYYIMNKTKINFTNDIETHPMLLLAAIITLLLILEFRLAHCFDDPLTLSNERFFLLHKSLLFS